MEDNKKNEGLSIKERWKKDEEIDNEKYPMFEKVEEEDSTSKNNKEEK